MQAWRSITSDREVLETVSGMPIPIEEMQHTNVSYPIDKKNDCQKEEEIKKLVSKGVLIECEHEPGDVVSPTFLTRKSDGGHQFILNLKRLNSSIEKKKFKMHTLSSILCMIRPSMYMAKLDIKDAYYSIPIQSQHQKYLKMKNNNKLFKYSVLPNGYTEEPRKFTKVMKPPLATLRKEKISIADYIDDLIKAN